MNRRLLVFAWAFLSLTANAFLEVPLTTANYVSRPFKEFLNPKAKATVLYFATEQCPLVRQYYPTLAKLKEEMGEDVQFFGIYSAAGTTTYSMALHALELDLTFRVLHDFKSDFARKLGAKTTTEVVVLDSKGAIVYRGAIDDQFRVGGRREEPAAQPLRDALKQLLAGDSVKVERIEASGCVIPYYEASKPPGREITYYEHIAPIIQNKCQTCHRPGQAGAVFDGFMSFEDVSNHGEMIQQVVREGRMPPSYTTVNNKFVKLKNDRRLTKAETGLIDGWVRAGMPAGDPAKAPKPVQWPAAGWKIGKPDVVVQMEKPFAVPATGILEYQFFKLKLNYPQDKWVQAVEIQPGNNEVVHHAELHIVKSDNEDYSGSSGMMKVYGFTGDKAVMLASFLPGDEDDNARVYPKGQAIKIPKNHDLVMEVHYTTVGKATTDRSRAGLIFANEPPATQICNHGFRYPRSQLIVPPYSEHTVGARELWFRKDVWLHSVRGHMHKIGKNWKLEWQTPNPDGEDKAPIRELLAAIPTWDFNWQRSFDFVEPLFVPAGQIILMTGSWDNSKHHPYNKDPQRPKEWGIQSDDEMLSTRVKFSIVNNPGGRISCMDVVP